MLLKLDPEKHAAAKLKDALCKKLQGESRSFPKSSNPSKKSCQPVNTEDTQLSNSLFQKASRKDPLKKSEQAKRNNCFFDLRVSAQSKV